jgi:hypothetical protein
MGVLSTSKMFIRETAFLVSDLEVTNLKRKVISEVDILVSLEEPNTLQLDSKLSNGHSELILDLQFLGEYNGSV